MGPATSCDEEQLCQLTAYLVEPAAISRTAKGLRKRAAENTWDMFGTNIDVRFFEGCFWEKYFDRTPLIGKSHPFGWLFHSDPVRAAVAA